MEHVRWLRVVLTLSTIAACITYVHLSSTTQNAVVHPTSVAFNTVQVGQTATLEITISPAFGEQSDVVESISEQAGGCPNFNLVLAPLPATVSSMCATGSAIPVEPAGSGSASCETFNTQSYSFSAQFSPTVAGAQSCTINLLVSGQASTIALTGTGQAPTIDIELETGTAASTSRCTDCVLDFGQNNVGVPSTAQVVKVVNTGSGTATLVSVSSTNAVFSVTGNLTNRPLGPNNGFESYNVTCTPAAQGPVTGTLDVVTNDPVTPNLSVMLTCNGVMSNLSPAPSALPLFARVGDSEATTLELTNTGTASLTITSIAFSSNEFSMSAGIVAGQVIAVGAGNKKTATVTYQPTVARANPVGKLTIVFDGNQTREITINGPAVDTTMSLSPTGPGATHDFGVACIGDSRVETFSLIANGGGFFELESAAILIANSGYSVTPSVSLPETLLPAAGNTVNLDVTFAPTATGTAPNALTLTTDIPTGESNFAVTLMGTGLPAGQTVTPTGPIDFGTITTGTSSLTPQLVTLTNCTPDPITITRAEITGDPDFVIATMPAAEVPASGQAVFEIALTPEFGGAKRGELAIEYTGGSANVILIGNANGPLRPDPTDPTEPDPRDSYYACNTGGSPSWLVMLAVVLVWSRRRRR